MKRRRARRRFLLRSSVLALGVVAGLFPGRAIAQDTGAQDTGAKTTSQIEIQGVDSRNHPEVTLTVEPPQELAEADLPAGAFTLVENGKRLPVEVERASETGGEGGSVQHLNVVLVVDTSGSMKGAPMEAAKAAAQNFVSSLPAGTHVGVVAFGSAPYVVSTVGTEPAAVAAALGGLQPSGETALYDAVLTALGELGNEKGSTNALVVLSDGGDTASAASLDQVVEALGTSPVEFAAVELVTPEYDGTGLRAMTDATQGLVLSADDPSRLQALYGDVAANLLNRYAVTYTTRIGGTTMVSLAVDWNGVTAKTSRPVVLSSLDGGIAVADPDTSVHPGPSWLGSAAALRVGLGLFFAGIALVGGWVMLRQRDAKVRMSRRFGVRGAFRMEAVSDWAERAADATQRRLDESGRGNALYGTLEQAGVALRPGEFVLLTALCSFVAFGVGFTLVGPIVGVLLAAAVGPAFPGVLHQKAKLRRNAFAEQLADTLQLLTGSLRAGHSILQAMDTVAHDAPSPTKEEFQRLVVETRLGRDLPDALRAMHERMGNQDFEWFVQALQIHREVGGDLAQILDTVANTIRARTRLRRQVKTLSAEGRLSAIILFILPIGVALVVSVMTPGYLTELVETAPGVAMLTSAGVFMTAGFFWLRKLVRIDF